MERTTCKRGVCDRLEKRGNAVCVGKRVGGGEIAVDNNKRELLRCFVILMQSEPIFYREAQD